MSYAGLHLWVRKRKPKPKLCQFCKRNNAVHLAKITYHYTKDVNGYKYLCVKCHSIFDKKNKTGQKAPTSKNGITKIRIFNKSKILEKGLK